MHPKWNAYIYIYIFLFLRRCTGRLFRFMLLQRAIESPSDQHNEETVYRRRKLWIAFVLRSRSCRLRGRLSNGNVAEWTKSTTKGPNERSSSIKGDQGANDDTPLVQRGCTRAHRCCTYPYRGDPQEGDKTRAKSRVWHTYLIAHATHTYTLTHYANHSKFIAETFKS